MLCIDKAIKEVCQVEGPLEWIVDIVYAWWTPKQSPNLIWIVAWKVEAHDTLK